MNMKEKENNAISILASDLTDNEKLRLYQFLLNLHRDKQIYKVNYTAKTAKSQVRTTKKRKFIRSVKMK